VRGPGDAEQGSLVQLQDLEGVGPRQGLVVSDAVLARGTKTKSAVVCRVPEQEHAAEPSSRQRATPATIIADPMPWSWRSGRTAIGPRDASITVEVPVSIVVRAKRI
jgi:hypothetical protein